MNAPTAGGPGQASLFQPDDHLDPDELDPDERQQPSRRHRPSGTVNPDRLARAALSRVCGPDDPRMHADVLQRGAAAVWASRAAEYPGVDPGGDLEEAEHLGVRMICPGEPEWPAALTALRRWRARSDTVVGEPFALWLRGAGDLAELAGSAVAVVGCRAASDYGAHAASELGYGLAERGWTVVSGAAFGVDAWAHRGALAAGGRSIAVLAGGVDMPYPRAHAALLEEIADSGLVLSESPPGTPPFRRRFLSRNRLIAGLARGTVLVEAGVRSGALNTARHARELERVVMALPGPVTSATSVGCHRLLRDHRESTVLVTSAADVVEEIGPVGALATPAAPPVGVRDGLPELVARLLDAMPATAWVGASVLAGRLGQPPAVVLAMLGPLAVEGLVEASPAGYRLTPLGRAPAPRADRDA